MSLYALLGHGRVLENLPLGANDSVFSCVSMRPIALKLLQKHSDRAGITQITPSSPTSLQNLPSITPWTYSEKFLEMVDPPLKGTCNEGICLRYDTFTVRTSNVVIATVSCVSQVLLR